MAEALGNRANAALDRLYGPEAAQRIRQAHVAIVGIGGVGSWAAEALGRSGVGTLSLVDFDHIAESNLNRQVHALQATVGASKVLAMKDRLLAIHPNLQVNAIDEFATAENWPAVLPAEPDVVVDACDDFKAKLHLVLSAQRLKQPLIVCGAAGGKRLAARLRLGDLSEVSHDPLLAKLRYTLRRNHGFAREGRMRVTCVSSSEAVLRPAEAGCETQPGQGSALGCLGYGSSVAVTATFGFAAAGWALEQLSKERVR